MNESRFGLNYDDPKFIRKCIDVGNFRGEPDTPEKMLFFAMIEECVLTATRQIGDWHKPCHHPGCGGGRTNQDCAKAYLKSKEFADICNSLNIEPDYFQRLMGQVKQKPKRKYRKGTARKEVALAKAETVEDRGDTRLPGETECAAGAPDLGGTLLCGEAPGCDSVPWGFCGYGEPERVGQGESQL